MVVDEKFKQALDEEIEKLMQNIFVLKNKDLYEKLYFLSAIYNNLVSVECQKEQVHFMEQSQEMMKGIDMSNVDVGELVNKLLGK